MNFEAVFILKVELNVKMLDGIQNSYSRLAIFLLYTLVFFTFSLMG